LARIALGAAERADRVLDLLARARAREHGARALEPRERLAVGEVAPALVEHGLVPLEAERLEHAQDLVGRAGDLARAVEVFHAHEPVAAARARLEVAADRGDQRTEVQRSCRRWGEASAVVVHRSAGLVGADIAGTVPGVLWCPPGLRSERQKELEEYE